MSRYRARVAGLACLGVVLAAAGFLAAGAGAHAVDSATLNITYTSSTTLQVSLGNGSTIVPSGGTLPAGSYMVYVYDANVDTNPNLTMNGPGVALSSNLNSTGMGIDQPAGFGPYTLQTSSTYTVEDTNIGSSSLITMMTTATATAGSTSSTGSSTIGGSSSTRTTTTTPSGHSVSPAVRGTLHASVGLAGTPTLTFDGKAVKRLVAGAYRVVVVDHSKKAEFLLGTSSRPAVVLSGAAATGTSSHTVTLRAGKWFFAASAHGHRTAFTVAA